MVKTSGGDMTSASTLFAHQQRWSLFRATGECRDARWTEQRAEGFDSPWRCSDASAARPAGGGLGMHCAATPTPSMVYSDVAYTGDADAWYGGRSPILNEE